MIQLEELTSYLHTKENIYLYGAGKVAERLTAYLEEKNVKVCGYIVTKKQHISNEYDGKPLLELSELPKSLADTSSFHVIVAIKGRCLDIKQLSVKLGFKSMIFMNECLLDELLLWHSKRNVEEFKKTYQTLQQKYTLISEQPKIEREMGVIFEKKVPLFRVFRFAYVADPITLKNHCTRVAFECQFGTLQILSSEYFQPFNRLKTVEGTPKQNDIIELYVATSHLDAMSPDHIKSEILLPIQVGAALTSIRKGCQTDDTDNHISMKNQEFCECTGLFWIWKNTSGQKYVGLEQYRRRLKLEGHDISKLNEYNIDVVLGLPQFVMKTVKNFFAGDLITEYDWQLMNDFILEYDRNYQPILNTYDKSWFYFSCNLCLFKREWFDRYCEFAFSVAFQIESFYNQHGIVRQDRYMGYIFENLLSIFMMRYYKEMNVVCTEVEWIE